MPQDTTLSIRVRNPLHNMRKTRSRVLVALERFLRLIMPDSADDDTLFNLLEQATGEIADLFSYRGIAMS